MPLVDDILKYSTVAVAGLEKNTGKTECVAYLIRQLSSRDKKAAITSAGLDGETTDQVTGTGKPEIHLPPGFVFSTSEKHFRERTIDAEILDVDRWHSATGRIVTARAKSNGKVIIAGPSHTEGLKELIFKLKHQLNCDIILIDGALSRISQAAPTIADGMILCTGAAISASINEAVRQTAHLCSLIKLERSKGVTSEKTANLKRGLWNISDDSNHQLITDDMLKMPSLEIVENNAHLYLSGALTDRIAAHFTNGTSKNIELTVADYTKIFASAHTLQLLKDKGNTITVVNPAHLIAVCVNPWSPTGYHFDAEEFENAVRQATGVPVYNIRKMKV